MENHQKAEALMNVHGKQGLLSFHSATMSDADPSVIYYLLKHHPAALVPLMPTADNDE